MSDDEFDDIADEDLVQAFEESSVPAGASQRPSQSFRQTTLWGETLQDGSGGTPMARQSFSNRAFRADLPPEAPTHHRLHPEALKTWVYPLNLGAIRDYQFSIVKNALFNNTLVALPTGLGKTFIAAAVMLNYYRWTQSAKIVFLAPTKPLAAQQCEACLSIVGIPRSQATYLTGAVQPRLREVEWGDKRLFFMTPQTFERDLSRGYADPKSIVLLVVDEAHRAKGHYAYVNVANFLRRFSKSFRVLALTATPGSNVEAVQEVIDSLGISSVEIRTEDSLDIRSYVHNRNIDTVVLDPSDEMVEIYDLFTPALKPLVDKLSQQNIWYGRDPMSINNYTLLMQLREWQQRAGRQANPATKGMIMSVFGILISLAHALKLLNFHGIRPFYNNVAQFREDAESKGDKGSKFKQQVIKHPSFQKMMDTVKRWLRMDGFVGHPKMTYLCDKLLNHFMDAGRDSATRAIVFSEYRDSAEEIVRVLNTHKPLIRATVFVGQQDSKTSDGMTQKQQIATVEKFKGGTFNVLVATSIGEEGLDIGQVDLIICYDASASPIRMLQRMGRTGRKRTGNIYLLLMKGKEQDSFAKAQDNYEKMQRIICEGSQFNFRHDLSTRIVPREIKPEVERRMIDIPIENSQDTSLPEPKKKRAAALGRKPASKKKFYMPDGVETGFQFASGRGGGSKSKPSKAEPKETDFLAEVPPLDGVLLDKQQRAEFRRLYTDLPLGDETIEEVLLPSLCQHPAAQRVLGPVSQVGHGSYTKRCVKLFKKLGKSQGQDSRYAKPYGETDTSRYSELPVTPFAWPPKGQSDSGPALANESRKRQYREASDGDRQDDTQSKRKKPRKSSTGKRKQQPKDVFDSDEDGEDDEEDDEDDEDAEDAEEEEPPPRRGAARARKPKSRFKTNGDHLVEQGDDCTRTSDMEETDGSDSGADLVDFIVGDDEVTSSMMMRQSTSPTTASPATKPSASATPQVAQPEPFFVPTSFSQISVTDDEMPDIGQLPSREAPAPRSRSRGMFAFRGTNHLGEAPARTSRQRKNRAILEESDEE